MDKGQRKNLGAADISSDLRREISKGNLRLHDRLPPERRLAEDYGVARGTMRAALLHLEKENYVKIRAGSGTYVTYAAQSNNNVIETANPLELMDTRFALEPHICRLAVLHGRRAKLDEIAKLCDKMESDRNDPASFGETDTRFHRALAHCTNNPLLIWIIDQITSVRDQDEWNRMRHLTLNEDIIGRYNAQHRQILIAIKNREPEKAANLMKEHLETARLTLTRAAET